MGYRKRKYSKKKRNRKRGGSKFLQRGGFRIT